MAQKFSFRPGTAITRSLRRAHLDPKSGRFFVSSQFDAGSDFRAAEDGEVELVERECRTTCGDVTSSQAKAIASFLK